MESGTSAEASNTNTSAEADTSNDLTSAPSTSASAFPSAPDTSVLRKYGNGKKAKQSDVDKLQLQQCMQNYFLSRTESRNNVDDDSSDSIFGKLIGKELSKITNEDVKAEVKQVLLTTVLNGQQQQRNLQAAHSGLLS